MNKLNRQFFKTKEIHKKNYNKYGWVLWILVVLILIFWLWWEIKSQMNENILAVFDEEKNQICLIESEFKIGLIDYLDSSDSIRIKIGEPDSIQEDSGMNSEIWYYDEIEIGLVNDYIYYIWCKDINIMTPNGIKIGLEKDEVSRILFGKKNSPWFTKCA